MKRPSPDTHAPLPRSRLWLEFALLFLLAPLGLAILVADDLVAPLGLLSGCATLFLVAVLLLSRSEGFRWRSLLAGPIVPDRGLTIAFAVITLAVALLLTWLLAPSALFNLPRNHTALWLSVLLFYPLASALPQEVVYRVLFFHRYRVLFGSQQQAVAANALVFSLAHLFYLNGVAIVLALIGGLVFAWAYAVLRSFSFALLLHAIAGWVLFSVGLGTAFFYHGNRLVP